jgi:hypothetical protein
MSAVAQYAIEQGVARPRLETHTVSRVTLASVYLHKMDGPVLWGHHEGGIVVGCRTRTSRDGATGR